MVAAALRVLCIVEPCVRDLIMSKSIFAAISNVQEAVLVLEVGVNLAHCRGGLRYGLVDEQEDGLLGRQLNALAYNPHELRDRNVVWHEELPLVNLGDL